MRTFGQSGLERVLLGCILENESVSPVTLQVVRDTWVSNSSVMVWLVMEGHGVQRERVGGMCIMAFASAVSFAVYTVSSSGSVTIFAVSLVHYRVVFSPL